jgi:predicted component of type VI protein secretion system
MSARWESQLLQPISEERPCGESLEDTELLASFDAFRLYGQSMPLDAPAEPNEKRIPKPVGSAEWAVIRDKALEALAKSKDLRLLATLGTALLRTDGVPAFSETLNVASQWLETHWGETYPLVDEDAILRRNALNCFADPMGVVDGLRRVPLVRSREHGTFSLRDVDIATHLLVPGEGAAAGITGGDAAAGEGAAAGGAVKSRQDAIRALDAVAEFFKRTEPSSPIPMFLARAKRLVSKDFLEVLADIAPEALAQARAAGGLGQGDTQSAKQGE